MLTQRMRDPKIPYFGSFCDKQRFFIRDHIIKQPEG
jgi:hypothetical protein